MFRHAAQWIGLAGTLMMTGAGLAQPTELGSAGNMRAATLMRLDFASSYRTEPVACDHLPSQSELVRGTLQMSVWPNTNSNAAHALRVSDVNWLLTPPERQRVSDDVLITGGGFYVLTRSVGMLPVLGHQLVLDLRVGDEAVRFDSGLVPRGSVWPAIDIEVHEVTNVEPCERRHFRVVASPVPLPEQHVYVLGNAAAFYFQASPLGPVILVPLGGPSRMINLPIEPGTQSVRGLSEWAKVAIQWAGGTPSNAEPFVVLNGGGCYQHVAATGAGVSLGRMQAELGVRTSLGFAAARRVRFDSGLVAGAVWPDDTVLPFLHIMIEDTDPGYPHMQVDVVSGPLPPA
ncbi:MAG: hypothetical protein KJZ65_00095 [Phycisphaerales bacterium]|nr:hypothetical protein [Phycisphaerales bacterium]